MDIQQRRTGTATATGVVSLLPTAPDYSRGEDVVTWLPVGAYNYMALQVEGLDGEVALQGCNGPDPTVAGDWYDLGTVTADGVIHVADKAIDFVRVNVTTLTSGTPTVHLSLEG